MKHKKHIDWKRISWTILVPIIIMSLTYGQWLIGNSVIGNEIENAVNNNLFPGIFMWFVKWIAGIAIISSPLITIFLCYRIYKLIKLIINFYYHNGE